MTTGQSPRTLKTAEQVQAEREADCERRGLILIPQTGYKTHETNLQRFDRGLRETRRGS